mmetsp:Transcript_18552/g.38942  ORF Transcript_18552/g.38942 Transcript_18552/m.38942 type:complete len:108 (-) Transcript_18552:2864-3187(-)
MVLPHVTLIVRSFGGPQQCKAHDVIAGRISVFAVVQKRKAETMLGQVAKALPTNLEFGDIPRCVPMRWALNVAELCLVRSEHGADARGEFRFQDLSILMPVDMCIKE